MTTTTTTMMTLFYFIHKFLSLRTLDNFNSRWIHIRYMFPSSLLLTNDEQEEDEKKELHLKRI